MKRPSIALAFLILAYCTRPTEARHTLRFENQTDQRVELVEANVVTSWTDGEFMTQPVAPHDQLLKMDSIGPGEQGEIKYLSLSEQSIDIRVTWPDGDISRYNVGYVDDLFSRSHQITATPSRTLLFDGRPPHARQINPESNP